MESEEMEMFWFFWLRFWHAYISTYDSAFWFSLGHTLSYDSDYNSNSNSVASENQPLRLMFSDGRQMIFTELRFFIT